MKVIVVGCGRLGSELTYRLYKQGHEVSVVDTEPSAFNSLPADFMGHLLEGDALNQDVLKRAGIETADALAAVTNSDSLNIAVGHVARKGFQIEKVVARNYNPQLKGLFEVFGLQVVSSTSWGAQRIEELIYHSEISTVFSAGNGEVEIYEVSIPAECNGRTLDDLMNGCEGIVVALTRGGTAVLPNKNMILETGDVIDISATFEGIEALRAQLCSLKEA